MRIPTRRWLGAATGVAVLACSISLIHPAPGLAADYAPAWSTVCAMGTSMADGCGAVRARTILDAASYPWSAIGRINIAGLKSRVHCTGALIGERLVLTAAHCLYDKRRRKWIRAPRIHFVAGFQRGAFVGHSTAIRYVVSKAHDIGGTEYRHRPQDDWALIELRDPIGARAGYLGWAMLDPGGLDSALRSGARLAVAGYPAVRSHVLSADMRCEGPRFRNGTVLLVRRCAVMKGDSGAPLLLFRDGKATVVAVLGGGMAGKDEIVSVSVPVASFHRTIMNIMGATHVERHMEGSAGRPAKPE